MYDWIKGWFWFWKERYKRLQAERALRRRTAEFNKAIKEGKKSRSRLFNWVHDQERKYFDALANIYEEQTAFYSLPTDDHPAYQAIIKMGIDALPYIIEDMRKDPDVVGHRQNGHKDGCFLIHWFVALHEITGENPTIKEEDRGRIRKLEQIWIKWLKEKGWIDEMRPM